jgi:hypothetical protein
MSFKRYKATCPDGTVVTRRTDRIYTHVLVVKDAKGWGAYGWIGRPDLIQAKIREATRYGRYTGPGEYAVLEVEIA